MTHTPGFPRSKLGEDERLRNAAPELLEALKGLFAHANRWAERGEPKPSCLQKAQAAIAKAEGK
jgi:hypothetical protein